MHACSRSRSSSKHHCNRTCGTARPSRRTIWKTTKSRSRTSICTQTTRRFSRSCFTTSAHLLFFQGSDTISGIRAANLFYNCEMAAYSVRATEHSIQCAYGPEGQEEYIARVLAAHAKPGNIVSLVLDGYNVWREAELLCTKFKDQIIASGAKIVFRPDSGDMFEVVPRLLEMQANAFGYTVNSKNKKVINHVGAIQGDGIDKTTFMLLMQKVVGLGYAPESAVM